jgi:serine/threonine protein kinase
VHVSLGREAAIKVFHPHVWDDPAFRVRFRRECEALMALEHPNVIPVLDAGESDDTGWIVMHLARGGTLAEPPHQAVRRQHRRGRRNGSTHGFPSRRATKHLHRHDADGAAHRE